MTGPYITIANGQTMKQHIEKWSIEFHEQLTEANHAEQATIQCMHNVGVKCQVINHVILPFAAH